MALLNEQMILYNLFFIVMVITNFLQVLSLQCKGEQNENVDWFVLYKMPKVTENKNPLIRKGVAYLYMDSNSFVNGWILSKKDISSNDSIPGYTLAPFYDDKIAPKLLWILYNDQPPNETARINNGHTKGAVIVNENEGFWLIHSVPNFPPEPNTGEEHTKPKTNNDLKKPGLIDNNNIQKGKYAYPSSGRVNGQSFLCISTNKTNFNAIGKQLMYNQIIIYRRNVPPNLLNKFTVLADAAKQVRIKVAPYNNKINVYSTNGMKFISFAKSSKWGKDLYEDFVAPQLNSDLYTETWLNGRAKLPSDCNHTRVMNIQSINLSKANIRFKSTHDHSKWAVSVEEKNKSSWVCIGDINRAETQFERGGGTICLNVPEVWKNYKNSVEDVEPCPKPVPKGFWSRLKSWFG